MSSKHAARHSWLFSFTDIAFLLLLVYTQLARMSTADSPVAEMLLPAPMVASSPELKVLKAARDYHQVLVEKHSDRPYRLVRIIGGGESSRGDALTFEELTVALQALVSKGKEPRPVVVPLPESFSSDLLQAAALVGKYWSDPGTAIVHTQRNGAIP
jgi:hypothetical protein